MRPEISVSTYNIKMTRFLSRFYSFIKKKEFLTVEKECFMDLRPVRPVATLALVATKIWFIKIKPTWSPCLVLGHLAGTGVVKYFEVEIF